MSSDEFGRMIIGKPGLADEIFADVEQQHLLENRKIRQLFGLFSIGDDVAGFVSVIGARKRELLASASRGEFAPRRAKRSAAIQSLRTEKP